MASGSLGWGQQVSLTLGSASTAPGGSVSLPLTLTPGAGVLPTAVQWRLTYPLASIASVTVTAGSAATAAGKTLACVNNAGWIDCTVYGMNGNAMAAGVIADVAVTVLQGIASTTAQVGVVNPASTNNAGSVLVTATMTGTVSIVAPPPPPSTWNISGTITSGSGATVALSGAMAKSAIADAAGNYTFTGLTNGSYTVTASKPGFTMTPASRAVTVNGASVTAVNFSAAAVVSTWSIFGTVTSGAGATVTLGGTASRSTTADAVGAYSFTGLVNGSYTVSAAKAGYTISPVSQAVTINGANVSGVLFSATAVPSTWTISGTITSGAGATVSLGGAATQTATADANGKYAFTGLAAGSYTVAPWKSSVTFTPAGRTVALNGADQTTVDFAGAQLSSSGPVRDVTVWTDRSKANTSIASPAFSTRQGNELLLAFIGTNSYTGIETVRGVTGGGLTWTLVRRTNTQGGTAEIWRAFATQPLNQAVVTASLSTSLRGMLTVMSFSGVDASNNGLGAIGAVSGANSPGAEQVATLVTTRNQSLVFGVVNDVTWTVARTLPTGQSMVHQFLDFWEGTSWVQGLDAPVATAGTSVSLSVVYPRWTAFNFSMVEVRGAVAALSEISGLGQGAGQPVNTAPANTSGSTGPASRRAAQTVLANAVTGEPGDACSPGGWASLLGNGFTGQQPMSATSVPLPLTLGGVRVKVNGVPAPLLMTSLEQVNFQCPQAAPGTALQVDVTAESGQSWQLPGSVMSPAAPAIFTVEGSGRAVVQIASTSQLALAADTTGVTRPARPGEHVRIYASGLGEAEVELAAGMPAPVDKPIAVKNRVTVVWNGQEIEPLFAGLVPGTVGVFQLDLEVPSGAIGSDVPLFLRVYLPDGTSRLSQQTVVAVGAEPALTASR